MVAFRRHILLHNVSIIPANIHRWPRLIRDFFSHACICHSMVIVILIRSVTKDDDQWFLEFLVMSSLDLCSKYGSSITTSTTTIVWRTSNKEEKATVLAISWTCTDITMTHLSRCLIKCDCTKVSKWISSSQEDRSINVLFWRLFQCLFSMW